jgi:hypothetical protein
MLIYLVVLEYLEIRFNSYLVYQSIQIIIKISDVEFI